jgi:hypothetical protein
MHCDSYADSMSTPTCLSFLAFEVTIQVSLAVLSSVAPYRYIRTYTLVLSDTKNMCRLTTTRAVYRSSQMRLICWDTGTRISSGFSPLGCCNAALVQATHHVVRPFAFAISAVHHSAAMCTCLSIGSSSGAVALQGTCLRGRRSRSPLVASDAICKGQRRIWADAPNLGASPRVWRRRETNPRRPTSAPSTTHSNHKREHRYCLAPDLCALFLFVGHFSCDSFPAMAMS